MDKLKLTCTFGENNSAKLLIVDISKSSVHARLISFEIALTHCTKISVVFQNMLNAPD